MITGIAKVGKVLYAHRAGITLTVGLISGGAALIEVARKSTKNTPKILEDHNEAVEDLKELYPNKEDLTKEEKKQYDTELIGIYKSTAWKLCKNYALAGGLTAVSATCILYSYKCIKGQYVAVSTAYAALSNKFDAYRENIRENYGEQADFNAMNDISSEQVEVGKGKTKTKHYVRNYGPISFTFDDTWGETFDRYDAGYNFTYIESVISKAQLKLDENTTSGILLEDIISCFGSVKNEDRRSVLPIDYQVLGYLPGDQIEVEFSYDRKVAQALTNNKLKASPITLTFTNVKPILSAIKPNDENAKILEDIYAGALYNISMDAEQALDDQLARRDYEEVAV